MHFVQNPLQFRNTILQELGFYQLFVTIILYITTQNDPKMDIIFSMKEKGITILELLTTPSITHFPFNLIIKKASSALALSMKVLQNFNWKINLFPPFLPLPFLS